MNFDVIIPARYASTRLPGKPLIDIAGKTLIERVYIAASKSAAARIIIATDDQRIKAVVEQFGGEVCLTSTEHVSGTDRLAEVVEQLNIADDRVVVNVQGDEPFIDGKLIDSVAQVLIQDDTLKMSTACHLIRDEAEINNPNIVKLVMDDMNRALYFSRSPIPFHRGEKMDYFQHMGIYGYRASFITQFSQMSASTLELSESLEQLRVIQAGYSIKVVKFNGIPSIGIDTPEDVQLAIERLQVE